MGDLSVVAGSHQNVAGLDVAGGTGGTGGDSDTSGVKIELDRFALGGLEAGVQEMRQAMGGGAVDATIGDFGKNAGAELVAERADLSFVVLREAMLGDVASGGGKTAGEDDVGGAGAAAVFLVAAEDEGLEGGASANVKGADADGAADFVGGDSEIIHAEDLNIHWDFTEGLGGVGMEASAGGVDGLGEVGDGLNGAELVIGQHDGNELIR